jgi:hypothetical protein
VALKIINSDDTDDARHEKEIEIILHSKIQSSGAASFYGRAWIISK